MEFDKIKNKGQARLFKSEYMEMMTKTHPIVIYSMYFPVIAFMLYYGASYKGLTIWLEVLLFIAGTLFWTFFEYLMHRFLFHMFVRESGGALRRVCRSYQCMACIMNIRVIRNACLCHPHRSLIVASIIFMMMHFVIGWNTLAFFPGFLFGYMLARFHGGDLKEGT